MIPRVFCRGGGGGEGKGCSPEPRWECPPSLGATDSSEKRQPKLGSLMKQVMGGRDEGSGTGSRGGEMLAAGAAATPGWLVKGRLWALEAGPASLQEQGDGWGNPRVAYSSPRHLSLISSAPPSSHLSPHPLSPPESEQFPPSHLPLLRCFSIVFPLSPRSQN